MLRYKTKTRPGLVALYDIRPGNGAGQFLQPQSPHGVLVQDDADMCFEVMIQLNCKLELSKEVLQHFNITVGAISWRQVEKKFIADDDCKSPWNSVHLVCFLYNQIQFNNSIIHSLPHV